MKDLILKSDCLTVHVNALGAELKGVEKDGLEFLWQGDKDSYPRTSPTLFPIMATRTSGGNQIMTLKAGQRVVSATTDLSSLPDGAKGLKKIKIPAAGVALN